MKQRAHRVVIVGGGAGGLELAARLGRRFGREHIILVDKEDSHIWKPSLHEVAAGTLDIHREGLSYFLLARQRGFTFFQGLMRGIDRDAKRIMLAPVHDSAGGEVFPSRNIAYDTLVLAVGSHTNFFGTPGASRYAFALDSTAQAEHFRQRLLREVAALNGRRAARRIAPDAGARGDSDDAEYTAPNIRAGSGKDDALHIAIVGGGATGVELAAELVEAVAGLAYYGMSGLDPSTDIKITLIEGADRILSNLPEKVSHKALQLLRTKEVAVRTSVRVATVGPNWLTDSEGGHHPADLCVWAAGIEAPTVLSQLGLETNERHQVVVDARLRSSDPHILAFGDCAEAPWQGKNRPLPAKAQVASQQAVFLLNALSARIQGDLESTGLFHFRDYGSLVTVGHTEGVGTLMGALSGKNWFIEGLLARLMYMSLHLKHHIAVLGWMQTGVLAIGRLLLRRGAPRVKLH